MSFRWSILIPALALAAVGCKTLSAATGTQPEPDYAKDADTNLKRGDDALDSKNYVEAEKYFEYVKAKYPFLDAAKIAELRLADVQYDREQWTEARDAYQNFIKLHPSHPKVDYAAFRAAMTHYKDIPSTLFFLPPPEEKDQVEVNAALRAMNDFIHQYPKSEYIPQAKEAATDCRARLAKHEMYVAKFYEKREKWNAVVGRLETLLKDYGDAGLDESALLMLHDAYARLNQPAKAKDALQRLIQKYPSSVEAGRARKLLGS